MSQRIFTPWHATLNRDPLHPRENALRMTKKSQALVTTTEYLKVILRAFSSCQDPEIPGVSRIALLHLDVVHVQNVPYDPLHHP